MEEKRTYTRKTAYNPASLKNLVRGFKKGHTSWAKGKKGWMPHNALAEWRAAGNVPWNKGLKGFMAGEKNGRWVKDRSKLVRENQKHIRNDYASQLWRRSVRKRFPDCVLKSDECSGRLEVHHICGWTKYPELRYEVDNGVTVCHFHHPKGRKAEREFISVGESIVRNALINQPN